MSLTSTQIRASGLGQACVEEIIKHGGNAAVLDLNEESGDELVKQLGSSARFFTCDVLETNSIAAAVQGSVNWAEQTGKPLGGVIPAAGVATPAMVRCLLIRCRPG